MKHGPSSTLLHLVAAAALIAPAGACKSLEYVEPAPEEDVTTPGGPDGATDTGGEKEVEPIIGEATQADLDFRIGVVKTLISWLYEKEAAIVQSPAALRTTVDPKGYNKRMLAQFPQFAAIFEGAVGFEVDSDPSKGQPHDQIRCIAPSFREGARQEGAECEMDTEERGGIMLAYYGWCEDSPPDASQNPDGETSLATACFVHTDGAQCFAIRWIRQAESDMHRATVREFRVGKDPFEGGEIAVPPHMMQHVDEVRKAVRHATFSSWLRLRDYEKGKAGGQKKRFIPKKKIR